MTNSYCFHCGKPKADLLAKCTTCYHAPSSEREVVLSLVMSGELCTESQLAYFSEEVAKHLHLSAPDSLIKKAEDLARQPKYQDYLSGLKSGVGSASKSKDAPIVRGDRGEFRTSSLFVNKSIETCLDLSPFAQLGASLRDNRKTIVELAETKALVADHDKCQKHRLDLTTPRARIKHEIAWLPGVSPSKAKALVEKLKVDPVGVITEGGISPLAKCNLIDSVIKISSHTNRPEDLASVVAELGEVFDEIRVADVLRDINEDRLVSGFPEVIASDAIDAELADRKSHYIDTIKSLFNELDASVLVETMTKIVEDSTNNGQNHATTLVDDLVDSYEIEAQRFLNDEGNNIRAILSAIENAASLNDLSALDRCLEKLEEVASNWDRVAQPIQLSAKARGIDDAASSDIAYSIRKVAIKLYNEFDLIDQTRQLTALLSELFAELPEVVDVLQNDEKTLTELAEEKVRSEKQQREWEEELTFSAEVGLLFKDVLGISPNGVTWKGKTYPLDTITRVRWGAVRNSVNGIPTGTDYTIAFGDNKTESVVQCKRDWVYTKFTDRLWRAVAPKIMTNILRHLRDGNTITIGDAKFDDTGVTLVKHVLFGSNERIKFKWSEINIWSASGSFYIGTKSDKKTYSTMSYMHDSNTHIVESLIRMKFKKPDISKISQLLE